MKKFDVIAIGELNVDLILNNIEGAPEVGKEKFAKEMNLTLGSSTAIFAANIACLGSRTGFVGMIGRDTFGDLIESSLFSKGVDTSMLIKSDRYSSGATICLNYHEDRANVTYQGAMDFMSLDDIDKTIFTKTKHIHLSSIFMQSGIQRDLMDILKTARDNNVTTSLDTQWDPNEKWDMDYEKVLPYVDAFLPNETELKFITRSMTLEEAVEKITPYIQICAVKRGRKGSLLLRKNQPPIHLEAFLNNNVIDAIGAGDSFNAGFIHAFVKGDTAENALITGNLTGAINTTAAGGTGAFTSKEAVKTIARERFNQSLKI
ncbi:MAG: carbohydrate kinase family protein [Proteiniphilum sp.]|jgi:sugar/nucleoside kinase (ribokinase family)|uniref:carbohydrate kinase family protein n=1 Tax=Proteiniphilum sp. TaxID=1926877 RepID=UPI00092682F2|nr:carbohydrate kinase family protein [Proteiniphilum sp.]MEA5129143.1 carbohydrate kinase family protein [Proteiniphilum sp.]OJV86054.1 MAG: carbohydrate kinase family protein [Bacteroidia bacterium 44-10]